MHKLIPVGVWAKNTSGCIIQSRDSWGDGNHIQPFPMRGMLCGFDLGLRFFFFGAVGSFFAEMGFALGGMRPLLFHV